MRILHVIDCINEKQGGPSVSVPRLAEAQADLGAGGRREVEGLEVRIS